MIRILDDADVGLRETMRYQFVALIRAANPDIDAATAKSWADASVTAFLAVSDADVERVKELEELLCDAAPTYWCAEGWGAMDSAVAYEKRVAATLGKGDK